MIKDDPLILSILKKIEEKASERESLICKGKVNSFDEYKKQVGFLFGLECVVEIIDQCLKDYGHDNDED